MTYFTEKQSESLPTFGEATEALATLISTATRIANSDLKSADRKALKTALNPLHTFTKDKRPEAYQARECAVLCGDIARELGDAKTLEASHLFFAASYSFCEVASNIEFADEMMKALEPAA